MQNWDRSLLNTTIYMYSEYVYLIMPRLTKGRFSFGDYNISLRIMTGHEIKHYEPCDWILICISSQLSRHLQMSKKSVINNVFEKRFFVLFHRTGKYLMVSEWTLNPRQLIITDIIINYWQRKWLEYDQISVIKISSGNFNGRSR